RWRVEADLQLILQLVVPDRLVGQRRVNPLNQLQILKNAVERRLNPRELLVQPVGGERLERVFRLVVVEIVRPIVRRWLRHCRTQVGRSKFANFPYNTTRNAVLTSPLEFS